MQLQTDDPDPTPTRHAVFVALASGVAVLALGLLAWLANSALLAPPLGATVFNAVRGHRNPDSDPRTIVVGHAIGLLGGLLSITLWAGPDAGSALRDSFELAHAAAAATAIVLTALGMGALRSIHPPAMATTLVGALGLMSGVVPALALLGGAVATASGVAIARSRSFETAVGADGWTAPSVPEFVDEPAERA